MTELRAGARVFAPQTIEERWREVAEWFGDALDEYARTDDFGALVAATSAIVADLKTRAKVAGRIRGITEHDGHCCDDCVLARLADENAQEIFDSECGDHLIAADEFDQTDVGAMLRRAAATDTDDDTDDDHGDDQS